MAGTPEAEAKFSVPPDLRLPSRWKLEGIGVRAPRHRRMTTAYYDSPDLRLARWGASLRYRAEEGWTIKLPDAGRGELLVRTEHRFHGGPGEPPAEAIDLVRALVRGSRLRCVATMRTRRSSRSLVDGAGREVAELVDDRVSVEGPGVAVPRFREIEVELRDSAPEGLVASVAERLDGAEPLGRSKLVRALGPRAEGVPDVVLPPVDAGATAAEVITAAIALSVLRLLRNDAETRLGTDPEAVHQCRVAVRRLRSDLRTFAPLLDPGWADGLRAELRWLGRPLGRVRDRDVLLEALGKRAEALPDPVRAPAEGLLRKLRAEREGHRGALLEDLRGDRYVSLLERLVEAARSPAFLPAAGEATSDRLLPLAAKRWRRLRRFVVEIGPQASDEELHQLRIRTKRARYAAEAVEVVGGAPLARFALAAAALQDALGILQDSVVAVDWLRENATRSSGPVGFAAGVLAAAVGRDAAEAREGWPKAWKKLAKRAPEGWS
jgi:CHAD domain-containing protein